MLLVDEDQEVRDALRPWLVEAGWQVFETDNGVGGWELVLQHRPTVVICDLLMPRCNGFCLTRLIRQYPTIKDTRIILSSGRGYLADRLNALQAGADEYLVKPVKQAQLMQLLERLLSPTPEAEKPAVITPVLQDDNVPVPMPLAEDGLTRIKFWGVRGSIPTPGAGTVYYGGNTSCVEVRADGEIIILDAGSGIRPLGLSLVKEFKQNPIHVTLLISHTHWDHIQGFPFFVPAYNPKNKVRVCGFEGSKEGLQGILSSQMESPYFPVSMQQMPGHISVEELSDMDFQIGRVNVQAAFMNHPGICVGYRLNTSCGSVAFLPDNEPYQRLRGGLNVSPEELAYARKQDSKLIDFIRGVDVLIIDSQYDDSEYQRHIGWGHGCLDDVVSLALFAGVKKLFLFHHDPGHDDAQLTRMVNWARDLVTMHGDPLVVEGAREGQEIILHPVPAPAT